MKYYDKDLYPSNMRKIIRKVPLGIDINNTHFYIFNLWQKL